MGFLIGILLVLLLISTGIASLVYKNQKKAGNNPWAWSIVTFILSTAILVAASLLVASYAFRFER